MWLAVLSAWASLLTFVACQSFSEDSTSWVRLKPLGQCLDGDTTCPYHIIIPPLTVQLPKPYRELEKMVQELQELTVLVNQLKEDCQVCKERRCLQWNLQTGDAGNRERIQASRGTLNTKDRQQDLYKRVIPAKSTEMRRPISSGQTMEKQRGNIGVEQNMDLGITGKNKETRERPLELNSHQRKRITGGMGYVGTITADEQKDHNSQRAVNQGGEQPTPHENHNYPAGTGRDTFKSIPDISIVSGYDFETQPDNIFKESILENNRKAQIDMTEPTMDNLRDKKVSDHVHDARDLDSNPSTFDDIYVSVAEDEGAGVVQQPTFNDKDRTEKNTQSVSHTEPGPIKHYTYAGTDIREEFNPAVTGLDILRSSSNTVDVSQTNTQNLDKKSERLFNPGTGTVPHVGTDSKPIQTAGTVNRDTLRSITSKSNPSFLTRVNDQSKTGQITSETIRVNLQNLDTDADMGSVNDPRPFNTSQTETGLETSKSYIFSALDKTLERRINQEALDRADSENPFNTNTKSETAIETDSRSPIVERAGEVDQKASAKPNLSGLVPGKPPAVDQSLPSGQLPANNPSVNQNSSGMPKRIMIPQPRESHPVKRPYVNQTQRGKYRPIGISSFRYPSEQRNTTGITQSGGFPNIKAPVKQKPSRILRPSGLLPFRFEADRTITNPNHVTQSEKNNSSRFDVVNSPKQRKPYIRLRLQGNSSSEAQNKSRDISDRTMNVDLKTSTQSNPKAKGHSVSSQGIVELANKAKHNVTATGVVFHSVANQQTENISQNTETTDVFGSEQQKPEWNGEQDQVTNGVRENTVETVINKSTASHDSYNNTRRNAQPPVEEEIKDSHSGKEKPRFQASDNENKKLLGVEQRQKNPLFIHGTGSDEEESDLSTTADDLYIKQSNIKEKDAKITQFNTPTVTTTYFMHQDHGETDTTNSAVILSDKSINPSQESESKSSAKKIFNDTNLGNKEFDPMLHNTSNTGSSNRGAVLQASSGNSIQDRTINPNLGVKVGVKDRTKTNVSTPHLTRMTQNQAIHIAEINVSTPYLENTAIQTEANDPNLISEKLMDSTGTKVLTPSIPKNSHNFNDLNSVVIDSINGSKKTIGSDLFPDNAGDMEPAVKNTSNVGGSTREVISQDNSGNSIQNRTINPNLVIKKRVEDNTRRNISTLTLTRATKNRGSQDSNQVIDITETRLSNPSLGDITIQNEANDPNLILEGFSENTKAKVLTPSITRTSENPDRGNDSTERKGSEPSSGNSRDSEQSAMNKSNVSAGTKLNAQTTNQTRARDPKLDLDRVVENTGSTPSPGENIQNGVVHSKSIIIERITGNTRTFISAPSTEELTTQNKDDDPVFMDKGKGSKGVTPSSAISAETYHKSLPNVELSEDKHEDNQVGPSLKDNNENVYQVSERDKAPQDCSDFTMRNPRSGVYRVTPNTTTFPVFCDMTSSGGGWTLIQHRFNGHVTFNRNWDDYKIGFGSLSGEFWLGNDKIHMLTAAKAMVLRVELEDLDGIKKYGQYDRFYVANETQHYRLTIGEYSGTAGNAMQYSKNFNHDQKNFTTPDRDNDQYSSGNCGAFYNSGWWFDACIAANLNGKYYKTRYKGIRNGIFWGTWHNISTESYLTDERQAFKTVRMMIKPRTGSV